LDRESLPLVHNYDDNDDINDDDDDIIDDDDDVSDDDNVSDNDNYIIFIFSSIYSFIFLFIYKVRFRSTSMDSD